MRKIVYSCDYCKKILSDGEISKQHLSLVFEEYSGWVRFGDYSKKAIMNKCWKHFVEVKGIKQFCDEKCLANYFKELKKKCQK